MQHDPKKVLHHIFFNSLNLSFSDGKCVIPAKGQLRCRKCRYAKCLANGMSPKFVLTTEEKKIRFRNFLKKKGDQVCLIIFE